MVIVVKTVNEYYNYSPKASQKYGAPRDGGRRSHRGTDISHSTKAGTPVPALLGGTVHNIVAPSTNHGFGHQLISEVSFGGRSYRVSYAHGRVKPPLSKGAVFAQGRKVLEEGTTGATTGPCVHIEVFDVGRGVYINPEPFIKDVLTTGDAASLKPTQRLVTAATLNRRATPDRSRAALPKGLKRGTVGNFVGWVYGESVNGNNVWLKGTSGNYFHSGGVSGGANVSGLKNMNAVAKTFKRTVKKIAGSSSINGRSQPVANGRVNQKLKRGVQGTFNGWTEGQTITQNGVTTNIWFRGAFNGNWFWAGNFTNRNVEGLPRV